MSKKFNVGDKVKVVVGNHLSGGDKGAVGVIFALRPHGLPYEVKFDHKTNFTHNGDRHREHQYRWYDDVNLELVEAKTYTTKYKPGDTVTVRSDLTNKAYYMTDGKNYMSPTDQMLTKRGKKVKIKSVTKTGKYMIEGSIFPWVDEMFVDEAKMKSTPVPEKKSNVSTKFKVGDKVRAIDNFYHITSLRNNWVGTVIDTKSDFPGDNLRVEDKIGHKYDVIDTHFELIKEEPKNPNWKIEITPDGEKTIAKYYEDGKMVKTVAVTRYYEDVYDPEAAAKFVTQKLFAEGRSIITVQFDSGSRKYDYLSKGLSIKRGDRVVVPVGEDNHHVAVTVVAIQPFAEDKLHVPISKMKYVDRVCTVEELTPKHKFKVGDKVRVKKDLESIGELYRMKNDVSGGYVALPTQVKMGGQIVTIKECGKDWYKVNEDKYNIKWTDGMFEDEVVKYYNGKVVCVSKDARDYAYTVGKVYEFKDGRVRIDNGTNQPMFKQITTLEEWNEDKSLHCKFIPFVE